MILQALNNAGGVKYLEEQARENPNGFMGLIGKTLPLKFGAEGKGSFLVSWQSSSNAS